MFRWETIPEIDINGQQSKMYRPRFEPIQSQVVPAEKKELDHHSFSHLGTELFMYKIMDANFIRFMEERGDLDRIKEIKIPVSA